MGPRNGVWYSGAVDDAAQMPETPGMDAVCEPAARSPLRRRRSRRPFGLLVILVALAVAGSLRHAGNRPEPLAAIADGVPVPMSDYLRQLRFERGGYIGPNAAATSPTGATILRLQQDQAVAQAIAEVLIARTAARYHLTASAQDVRAELARRTAAAGGQKAIAADLRRAGMSLDDLRRAAHYIVLRDAIARRLGDPLWLDTLVAHARITYYVGDGVGGSQDVPAVALGHPAPPFVAIDLAGHARSLAGLMGRPVVLTFWNTTCIWCGPELPLLQRFAAGHPRLPVVVIDEREDGRSVRAYLAANHISGLEVWLDGDGRIGGDYTVSDLPATLFIDRTGMIRSYNFGPLADWNALVQQADHAVRQIDNTSWGA
jgi:thiol-disulfide isomerase/thioredoxin